MEDSFQIPDDDLVELLMSSGFDQRRINIIKNNLVNAFSNGRIVAEIISHHSPRTINLSQYVDEVSVRRRSENWKMLKNVLSSLGMSISNIEIEDFINRRITKREAFYLVKKIIEHLKKNTPIKSLNRSKDSISNASIPRGKPKSKSSIDISNIDIDAEFEKLALHLRSESVARSQSIDLLQAKTEKLDHKLLMLREHNLEELAKVERKLVRSKLDLEQALSKIPPNNSVSKIDLSSYLSLSPREKTQATSPTRSPKKTIPLHQFSSPDSSPSKSVFQFTPMT